MEHFLQPLMRYPPLHSTFCEACVRGTGVSPVSPHGRKGLNKCCWEKAQGWRIPWFPGGRCASLRLRFLDFVSFYQTLPLGENGLEQSCHYYHYYFILARNCSLKVCSFQDWKTKSGALIFMSCEATFLYFHLLFPLPRSYHLHTAPRPRHTITAKETRVPQSPDVASCLGCG